MASHHFIGTGPISASLASAAADPDGLLDAVEELVSDAGLRVMARKFVVFPNGGQTLVWILAESHLVLHNWLEEGFATIDLHVCDYHASNREKARALRDVLAAYCFPPGTASWKEVSVEDPEPQAPAEEAPLSGRSATAAIR